MTTPEQQGSQPLTRKQLRELRQTGSNPVIDDGNVPVRTDLTSLFGPSPSPAEDTAVPSPEKIAPLDDLFRADTATPEAAPQERSDAAGGTPVHDVQPVSTGAVEVHDPVSGRTLTRRELRELEKQRESAETGTAPAEEEDVRDQTHVEPAEAEGPVSAGEPPVDSEEERGAGSPLDAEAPGPVAVLRPEQPSAAVPAKGTEISASFGDRVRESAAAPEGIDPAFDEAVASADTTGSQHIAPTALIFNQTPGPLTLSGPLSSGGDLLVTGSYELPSTVGSHGHAPGMNDGKDVDAALVDLELAASSSPTPVAASAAIGTIKPAGEVMRQPAPEKGGKLLMGLSITAGALAIALTVALVLAFTNGVF